MSSKDKRTVRMIASDRESNQPNKKRKIRPVKKTKQLSIENTNKSHRDFNKYFGQSTESAVESTSHDLGNLEQNVEICREKLSNVRRDQFTSKTRVDVAASDRHQTKQKKMSNEELTKMVCEMSAISQVTMKYLKLAYEKLNVHRTNSSLGVRSDCVNEKDASLLEMFEKKNLPLKTKQEVEELEKELENSPDFLKFFVRRIVPIVKNLYQNQKSILEGFLCSLISRDVVTQFRWAGRMEKSAFKELKNIQIVLLSAMVRVDRNYTLFQFENDIKSVLTKCTIALKKTKKIVDKETADENEYLMTDSESKKERSVDESSVDVNNNDKCVTTEKSDDKTATVENECLAIDSECKKETRFNQSCSDD